MKRFIIHFVIVILPYIAVMVAWLLSFGGFNYQLTVINEDFYAAMFIYLIFFQWFFHMAADVLIFNN